MKARMAKATIEVLKGKNRLRECIAELAGAIDRGECVPTAGELDALVAICEQCGCHVEAARVRRWLEASAS